MHKINFICALVFEILEFQKPLCACMGIPDNNHLNLHEQFITLINMKLMHKINFIPPLVFEMLKF